MIGRNLCGAQVTNSGTGRHLRCASGGTEFGMRGDRELSPAGDPSEQMGLGRPCEVKPARARAETLRDEIKRVMLAIEHMPRKNC